VAVKPWIQAAKPARVQAPPPEPIKPPTIAKVKSEKRRSQGKISFDGTHEFKPGKRVMKYIGFRQKAQVSEVFIRCDGKTKFRVVEDSNTKVVIELFDTTIRLKNNQRALDTSFFPTAVKRVHARADAAGTRVEIALRHKVPYEVKRVGSTIKLLFNNAAR